MKPTLSDADVIAAIQAHHLKANISDHEDHGCLMWDHAWVDRGGTIFGLGPYVHVPLGRCPLGWEENEDVVIRVYAPERLRKRLAVQWTADPDLV